MNAERKYRWNKKELEKIFSILPIDSIDSFFASPNIVRKELWEGLRAIDLNQFQYDGEEKKLFQDFIQELDNFCFMGYEQTPSGHWKYQALADNEPFDEIKEHKKMKELYEKAALLKPFYDEVKKVLIKYHVDIKDINCRAIEFYSQNDR